MESNRIDVLVQWPFSNIYPMYWSNDPTIRPFFRIKSGTDLYAVNHILVIFCKHPFFCSKVRVQIINDFLNGNSSSVFHVMFNVYFIFTKASHESGILRNRIGNSVFSSPILCKTSYFLSVGTVKS